MADDIEALVEDATLDFSLGDNEAARAKLEQAVTADPQSFAAWHALAEVHFARNDYDAALHAAEQAHALDADDIHINTSLSRIWMERGDKPKAEHFGAQARMLGWKQTLQRPQGASDDDEEEDL